MSIKGLSRPSRFVFWCTAPFLVATLTLLPFLANPVGVLGWIGLAAIELLAILSLFGLYDADRFNWCLRGVGGIVFAGYVVYLIQMVCLGRWIDNGRQSSANVGNAVLGLVTFGIPGFVYAFFGRFTWHAESESEDCYTDSVSSAEESDRVSKSG